MTELPPLNLNEDNKKYEAFNETVEVKFPGCDHKGKVSFVGDDLRCTCGAAWTGSRLTELYQLLNSK